MKKALFLLFLILLFLSFNSGIVHSSVTRYADEFLLFTSVAVLLAYTSRQIIGGRIQKILLLFAMYLCYQVINFKLSPFHLKLVPVLVQSLITIKLFVVATAVLLIIKERVFSPKLVRVFYYLCICLFLLGLTMNWIMQEDWHYWIAFPGEAYVRYRYGFLRPVGWFNSVGANGWFLSLFLVTFVFIKMRFSGGNRLILSSLLVVLISALAVGPLTVRKVMIVVFPLGMLLIKALPRYERLAGICFVVVVAFLTVWLLKDSEIVRISFKNFSSTMKGDERYIRGFMMYHGLSLFIDFFPFGVGSATFGTVLSQYNTLEVYEYVGMPLSRFELGELKGVFDSGLFSAIAENGFFGMLLVGYIVREFFVVNRNKLSPYAYMIFKLITWIAILLSISGPAWASGTFATLYTINLLFIYANDDAAERTSTRLAQVREKTSIIAGSREVHENTIG